MMRAVLCIVALAASACASHSVEKSQAWCSRYAAKQMAYGVHEDLNAYREDLMSSCMAMKGVPYANAPASGGTRKSAN